MKNYFPADEPAHDSIEYKLLNLRFCWFYPDEQYLQINYQRHQDTFQDSVDYAELRQLHQMLPETLESLIISNPQGSLGLSSGVIVVTSHLLGAVVDIKRVYPRHKGYRYMADIAFVNSVSDTNKFRVTCDSYDVAVHEATGLFVPCTELVNEVTLPGKAIDAIWPGSSRSVPAMEELGYSPKEIMAALLAPTAMSASPISMTGISLI